MHKDSMRVPPAPALTFRVGGKYRTRGGWGAEIISGDHTHVPWFVRHDVGRIGGASNESWHRPDGTHGHHNRMADLVTDLVADDVAAPVAPIAPVTVHCGMMIRNLRADGVVGCVVDVPPSLRVAYHDDMEGRGQIMTPDADVRWPWETDLDWRRVTPERVPEPESDTVNLDDIGVGAVLRTRVGRLVHYIDTRGASEVTTPLVPGEQRLEERMRYLDCGAEFWIRSDGKARRDGTASPYDVVEVVSLSVI